MKQLIQMANVRRSKIERVIFFFMLVFILPVLSSTSFAVGPHSSYLNQYRADNNAAIPFGTGIISTGVGVYFVADVGTTYL